MADYFFCYLNGDLTSGQFLGYCSDPLMDGFKVIILFHSTNLLQTTIITYFISFSDKKNSKYDERKICEKMKLNFQLLLYWLYQPTTSISTFNINNQRSTSTSQHQNSFIRKVRLYFYDFKTPLDNFNSGIVQLVSYQKQCGTISKLVRSLITVFIYPISQGCRYNYNFLLPLN